MLGDSNLRRQPPHPVPPRSSVRIAVSSAEHAGVTGRAHVEIDYVSRLGLEVGLVRRHVARQAARPAGRPPPDPLYDVLVDTHVGRGGGGTTSGRPVRRRVWRPARGRAAVPPASTAAAAGDSSSGPPRRAPEAGAATRRWSVERDVELRLHRPSGNALGEVQLDLGALDESRGHGVRAGRSPRGHHDVRRSDETGCPSRAIDVESGRRQRRRATIRSPTCRHPFRQRATLATQTAPGAAHPRPSARCTAARRPVIGVPMPPDGRSTALS